MKRKRILFRPEFKVVLSGSILEFLRFKKLVGGDEFPVVDSRRIAATRLKRSINVNAGQWYDPGLKRWFLPLFLTLTFEENLEDIKIANGLFTDFIKRFSYHFLGQKKSNLKYSAVIEFQKRGAVHYHVILYNVPFIPELSSRVADVWGHGFIFINAIRHVRNVGAYIVKYMTKDNTDVRLRGKKSYFQSRGLLKPIKTTDEQTIEDYISLLSEDSFIMKFECEDFEYQRHSVQNSVLRLLNTSRSQLSKGGAPSAESMAYENAVIGADKIPNHKQGHLFNNWESSQ